MGESIKDGTGTGNEQRVDSNNRSHVQSASLDVAVIELLKGNAYDISTGGPITLTDATDSALLYIKNNGDNRLIVNTLFIDSSDSTGGSGTGTLTWHLNPNAGTLIDEAIEGQKVSRHIGLPFNISVDAFKAAGVGKTLTGGDDISFPLPAGVGIPFGKPFVIPKGQSFGVRYQPPAGNTSMTIQVGLLILEDTISNPK